MKDCEKIELLQEQIVLLKDIINLKDRVINYMESGQPTNVFPVYYNQCPQCNKVFSREEMHICYSTCKSTSSDKIQLTQNGIW